jgi:Gnt-I system high-affinity gluconate transporter
MTIIITIVGILLLVVLITVTRLPAFIAFLLVASSLGIAFGMKPAAIATAIQNGIGSTLSPIVSIIALGAMLGKLVAISGSAEQISKTVVRWFGSNNLRWAFLLIGFITGLPLFYSVGFMLLVPLALSAAVKYKQPAIYVGLPLLASLSVTQGYLPPHPAPLYLQEQLHASMIKTLAYGIIISVPAILVSGILWGNVVKNITTAPNDSFVAKEGVVTKLPSVLMSFTIVLLPVVLISVGTVLTAFVPTNSGAFYFFQFIGNATNSLLITVLLGLFYVIVKQGNDRNIIAARLGESIKDVAGLILIFGGAGALKQILTDGGVSQTLADYMSHSSMNIYVLGWSIAAVIRVCVGSSTVAGITTVGFIVPMMAGHAASPELMVLSIGAGSMMFSHVNDTGFWLFREYFQLSLKDTIKSWSIMDTIVSVVGLLGVLVLSLFVK